MFSRFFSEEVSTFTRAIPDERFFLSSQDFEPAYMALYRTGELHRRAEEAVKRLQHCLVCPRNCGVDRLAQMMLELQRLGCHNINFVTPEHVVPQILEALPIAVERGLRLPIVYNTSAYDSMDSLHLMDGIVDIYMPDFKFWDERLSLTYLKAKDYPEAARLVILEMHRQVGELKFDEFGLARRGLLVRHLVMPGNIAGSEDIMRFLAEQVSADTYVNVMAQYYPAGKVSEEKYTEINRHTTTREYLEAVQVAHRAGLWRLDERIPRRPDLRWYSN